MAIVKVPRFNNAQDAPVDVRVPADDGLQAFETEAGESRKLSKSRREPTPSPATPSRGLLARTLMVLGMVVTGAALTFGGLWAYQKFGTAPAPATLSLQTSPAGASVTVNDQPSGTTPVALTLAAGTYRVRLTTPDGQERSLDVTLNAGESQVQRIEWAAAAAAPVTTGALQVQTEPPGQTVFVDDVRRGATPLMVPGLTPGEHRLLVTGATGSFSQRITVTAGNTVNVVVAPRAPAVSAGWVRVVSPVLVQMRVAGDLVGNSESDRVMLPAGEHQVDLSNEALGFAMRRAVTVSAGRTSELRVPVPNGVLNINATPWAEVWLDGARLGETPLGNVSTPIGTHRVTLRHPQFGERQTTVTVSLKETARLGVDMRQR